MRISCCMILKDEGQTIGECLERALPAVDEFVIGIDAATSDNTREEIREVIREDGHKTDWIVYDFTWEGDFSKARNEGIEKATGDWVLILDGHEFLRRPSADAIRPILEKVGDRFDQIHARMYHRPDEYGNPGDFTRQARLIRKDSGLRYKHAQHNFIPVPDQARAAACAELIIEHHQPESRKLARGEQNKARRPEYFRALVEKNPEDWWARHYLAVALKGGGDTAGALKEWGEIVDNAAKAAPRWLPALLNVVEGLGSKGKHGKAVDMVRRAWPEFMDRREPYILLGCAERARGNIDEAIRWLNIAAHMPEPAAAHMTLSGPAYTWLPFKELAESYLMAGNLAAASACAERALEFRPGDAALKSIADNIAKSARERDGGRRVKIVSIFDSIGSFSGGVEKCLQEHNRATRFQKYAGPMAEFSDAVFVEWCDMNAIAASRNPNIKRLVVRLVTYEAYTNMPDAVNWENVDLLIVPTDHVRRLANERFNLARFPNLKQSTITVPIDVEHFAYQEREKTKRVAWVGYLNWKKGVPLFFEIARMNPDYQFTVAGKFQDWDTRRYFETNRPQNVTLDGWQADIQSWLEDKTYILNTSLREGLPGSVLEGMAMGLRPIVHRWPGADEVLPGAALFDNAVEVAALLAEPLDNGRFRQWVEDRHDSRAILPRMADAILGEGEFAEGE